MVMGVDDGNTLILNRKLPSTVKPGDLIQVEPNTGKLVA
jgi:hypothetical protein